MKIMPKHLQICNCLAMLMELVALGNEKKNEFSFCISLVFS